MQKDLFGGAIAAAVLPTQSESKTDFLQKYTLTLRLDQAIIAVLTLMVAYVLVFSFGVESGKRFAMAEIKAERSMRERMARELGEKIFANSTAAAGGATVTPAVSADLSKSKNAPAVKAFEVSAAVKTETSAPAKEAVETSKAGGRFAIQTVTFTSKAAAEKHIKLLASKGYQGSIIPKGKFQQVCVTGFENKEKASQAMTKLKSQGLAPKDAYIRPIA